MSSFDRSHRVKLGYALETNVVEIKVCCASAEGILIEHGMLGINLLIVDTEGYGFAILNELDYTKVKPKLIHFEHGVLERTMCPNQLMKIVKKLNSCDYQVIVNNNDGISIKSDFKTYAVAASTKM